jgi:hypothetical protein
MWRMAAHCGYTLVKTGLTMLSKLKLTMCAEHIQVKLLCPTHDWHREALQAGNCSTLQQSKTCSDKCHSICVPLKHKGMAGTLVTDGAFPCSIPA